MDNYIVTKAGLKYYYHHGLFSFVPSLSIDLNDDDFVENKRMWDEEDSYLNKSIDFKCDCDIYNVKYNLSNIRQIIIEVTDKCNLNCYYCTYGELYNNYDKRCDKNQLFDNVRKIIDAYLSVSNTSFNVSFNKMVYISFYGGEPLLNMPLIKEIISYMEEMSSENIIFRYNMTTNGVLLDKYMDYLQSKNISLLISIDGNKFNSSYRVYKSGKESFDVVYNNVKLLKYTYLDYFKEKVNLNVVLHDRNSVEESCSFLLKEFDKIPRIGELTLNGLSSEGKKIINGLYNDKFESYFKSSEKIKKCNSDFLYQSSGIMYFYTFLKGFVHCVFDSYLDLFEDENTTIYPTGTCAPFEKKLFFTVNRKLLPCEKVGQNCSVDILRDENIDYSCICTFYSSYYKQIVDQCKRCLLKRNCGQCMFLMERENGLLKCPEFLPLEKSINYFATYLGYAEQNINAYESISDISIE